MNRTATKRALALVAAGLAAAASAPSAAGADPGLVQANPDPPARGNKPFVDGIEPTPAPILTSLPVNERPAEGGGLYYADDDGGSAVSAEATATASNNTFPMRHYASLWPWPGYPNSQYSTNSCYQRQITSSSNLYMCRYVWDFDTHIAHFSALIKHKSTTDGTYGFAITTASAVYEGCKDTGSEYVCNFYTARQWDRRTTTSQYNYYMNAFRQTKATADCGYQMSKVWRGTVDWNNLSTKCSNLSF